MDPETASDIAEAVTAHINAEFSPSQILAPDDGIRQAIIERIRYWTQSELRARGLGYVDYHVEADLALRIQHQMLGLGFLEPLLDHGGLSEIMMNQDGTIWVLLRGEVNPIRVEEIFPDFTRPSITEVRVVLDKLLGAVGRRVNEAEPIASAKLPRSPKIPAGARVNVVMPRIANGEYPALNIRFYEAKPVKPDQLLEWGMLNERILETLVHIVHRQGRLMIAGGTATGKTTFLCGLAHEIPPQHRVILVEDPAEIFLEHPHVVSLEARPATVEGRYGISVGDLVTTAMRMTPRWLIVGEIRHGKAAVWLLRAQMSDHPGMSTIHADDPQSAVETLCLLAMIDNDPPVRYQAAKALIARAVHYFIQIGIDPWGIRRVMRVGQVDPELKAGEVFIHDIFLYRPEQSSCGQPVWEQLAEPTRFQTAVG
ncbi:MAG: CpaF family protein [Anaerolineae bacterium]